MLLVLARLRLVQRRARLRLRRVGAEDRVRGRAEHAGRELHEVRAAGGQRRGTTGRWRHPSGSRRRGRGTPSAPRCRPGPGPGTACPRPCRCAHGRTTSFWQLASARFCSASGMLSRVRRASAGIVGRRSAARPRSSSWETSPRSWRTSGIEASSAASEERTPGRMSAVNARSGGKEALSDASAGWAARSVRGSSAIASAQVVLLAGERAGGRVEVGDQALELLGVAVQRRGRRAGVLDVAREVVLGLAERGLVDDRGVAVGALPVRDRAVEGLGAALVERLAVLVEQRLEVLARVGLQRGQQLVELHRARRSG